MALTENIFDIVKRAKSLDFEYELSDWKSRAYTLPNEYDNHYRKGMIFKQFKSIEDSFKTIDEQRTNPNKTEETKAALKKVVKSEFNSSDTFIKELNKEDKSNTETKEISKNILENIKSFIQLGGLYANDRLIVTQDKRGMFDFGLASLGLYRPIEFFSSELLKDIKNGVQKNEYLNLVDGVVDVLAVECPSVKVFGPSKAGAELEASKVRIE